MSKPNDLVQGTLDLLILKILALEPLNGWAISQLPRQIWEGTGSKRRSAVSGTTQAGAGWLDYGRVDTQRR